MKWGKEELERAGEAAGNCLAGEGVSWRKIGVGVGLLLKVPIRSHIEVEEVDLPLVPVCLQKGFHFSSQEGSFRTFLPEGLLLRRSRGKLRPE